MNSNHEDSEMSDLTRLRGPGAAELSRIASLEHWEDQLVDWLFVQHRVKGTKRERIRQESQAATGNNYVPLEAWNAAFPRYPVWFAATVLRHIDKISPLTLLLCQMSHSQLTKKFLAAVEEAGNIGRPVGLIIRWPHLVQRGETSGGLVLHNRQPDYSVAGTRLVWTYNEPEHGQLVLQTLSSLVREIISSRLS